MYKNFFGLRENPFNVNPDPRFLYETAHTREALACLRYGVENRKGFVLLTGEVGTGKTTLLNTLLDWLRGEGVATAFVFNPRLSTSQFFDFMLTDFGIAPEPRPAGEGGNAPKFLKSQMLLRFNQWLLEQHRAGRTAVLVVDEAQNLSPAVLEEIRLLTNLETSTEKLLQIVLAGQPELERKLASPELRQLRQRITLRCKTWALTMEETEAYVSERLRVAGSSGRVVFTADALEKIHSFSKGIPRVVNLLCEHALISAFVEQQKQVRAETIEEVAREFELDVVSPILAGEERRAPAAASPRTAGAGENVRLMEALEGLTSLMDRLREEGRK
jgi:type II secretory pathway predicted ATPase ExeA